MKSPTHQGFSGFGPDCFKSSRPDQKTIKCLTEYVRHLFLAPSALRGSRSDVYRDRPDPPSNRPQNKIYCKSNVFFPKTGGVMGTVADLDVMN